MPRCLQRITLIFLTLLAIPALAQESPDSVSFRITEVSSKALGNVQEKVWLATHESRRGVARFRITMQLKPASGDSPFMFSKGSFEHVADSNPAEFLKQLSSALAARKPEAPRAKVQTLPFAIAILGIGRSRAEEGGEIAGGFSSKPGPWIVTKIFLADGEGEVFLNLDPESGVGEFSIKDEGYGDIVIRELSRVL
jgi:hypothetical protein